MESKKDKEVRDKLTALSGQTEQSSIAQEAADAWSQPKSSQRGAKEVNSRPHAEREALHLTGEAKTKVDGRRNYLGEFIALNVMPKTWIVASGATVEQIAAKHLGAGATPDHVAKHMEEICRVNHLGGDADLVKGMKLYLPGHTIDGGFTTLDRQGNSKTVWRDGTEVIQYLNGLSMRRWETRDSTYYEEYRGPRPENYFLVQRDDHGLSKIWGDGIHGLPLGLGDVNVKAEHDRLLHLAEQQIRHPALLAKFQVDMARFEARSYELEASLEKQGLTPEKAERQAKEEIQNTYKEISRLLTAKDNAEVPINVHRRLDIAEQILSQAATPTSIQQGEYNTCNVGVVEVRTYSRQPSEAARLVVDIATTGQFVAKDGTKVVLDTDSLYAHGSARLHPPRDGGRSLANQLFQTTAVNLYYGKSRTKFRYECHEREWSSVPPDNGERIFDYSVKPPKEVLAFKPSWTQSLFEGKEEVPLRAPGLSCDAIVSIGNSISGKEEKDWLLVHDGIKSGDSAVGRITSAIDLDNKLEQAKATGQLPLVVYVQTDNEPFYSNSGASFAGGRGGAHVVSIVDYQPGLNPKVSLDNQWRASEDHFGKNQISTQDLYLTLRGATEPQNLAELESIIMQQRKSGLPDYLKELDLVRLRKDSHLINEDQYEVQLKARIRQMGAAYALELAQDKVDWNKHIKLNQELDFLVSRLPLNKRLELIDLQRTSGFASMSEYAWKVVNVVSYARFEQLRDHKTNSEMLLCTGQLQRSLREVPSEEAARIRMEISKRISFYKRVLGTKV